MIWCQKSCKSCSHKQICTFNFALDLPFVSWPSYRNMIILSAKINYTYSENRWTSLIWTQLFELPVVSNSKPLDLPFSHFAIGYSELLRFFRIYFSFPLLARNSGVPLFLGTLCIICLYWIWLHIVFWWEGILFCSSAEHMCQTKDSILFASHAKRRRTIEPQINSVIYQYWLRILVCFNNPCMTSLLFTCQN